MSRPVRAHRRLIVRALAAVVLAAGPGFGAEIVTRTFDVPSGNPALWYLSGDVPALVTADLMFRNGDHHLKHFGVVPHDGTGPSTDYLVQFSDLDGGDRYSGTVRWADLWQQNLPRSVARGGCAGTCRLTIPRLARWQQVFVLSGFQLSFSEAGTDRHVREIAIVPSPYDGFVDVTFTDDSGGRPFSVELRYLVLPYGLAVGENIRQGSVVGGGNSEVAIPAGQAVLQGFRLRFSNSDHHLERFAVDLHDNRIRTHWRDGDANDPYTWWVSYATLAP